jgi:hypothetical protein
VTINVGIDYDEPIFDWYDEAHNVCLAAGVADPDAPPPTTWDPSSHYGITLEEWYEVLDKEILRGMEGMYGLPLRPERVEQVRRLYTLGYGVHIITARGQFGKRTEMIKRLTRGQIVRSNMPYDSLTFAYDKADSARRLNLDYFLDDGPRNFDGVQPVVPQGTYLLTKPWNIDHPVDPWYRMDSLEDFVDLVVNRHGDLSQLTTAQRRHVYNVSVRA